MKITLIFLVIAVWIFSGCESSTDSNQVFSDEWLIPTDDINLNALLDNIPAIEKPEFENIQNSRFVFENNYVNVIRHNGRVRIYPQQITNWHEVVNDQLDDWKFSLTFCPVTGSVLIWDRVINQQATTFGVSGMQYESNLILYDRATKSFWSQMYFQCVNGQRIRTYAEFGQSIEMNYELATTLFPEAEVLSPHTGYDFPYHLNTNNKLPGHDRYYGVFPGNDVLLFRQDDMLGELVIHNIDYKGESLVLIASERFRYMTVLDRKLADGTVLFFKAPATLFPAVIEDNEGNNWNIFGEALDGPRQGQKMKWPNGYLAFKFAWDDLFPNHIIWKPEE